MKKALIVFLVTLTISATYAQVGINADNSAPHSSAQLDVKSTTKAFYPPRMTTVQKNGIASPQAGAVVFDNTLNQLSFYNGSSWVAAAGGGLTLPYNQSQSFTSGSGALFKVTNTATGFYSNAIWGETDGGSSSSGIRGVNNSQNNVGMGVLGIHYGGGSGVNGQSESGKGVYGFSESDAGVYGNSRQGPGGLFTSVNGYALITETGKVGLGTTTPNLNADERVDIFGRLRIRDSLSTAGVWFNNSANSVSYLDGAFYGMKINTETGIFIGGNWRFWVNNLGNGYLNGNLIQTSDRRLKKDFSLLNNSLLDVYQLNGYHFKWKEEARNKDLQTGLIAQEVQKIFPELVQTDEKGFLSVNYIGLVPHLIEAVKELKNENDLLKSENKSTLERLEKIEVILNAFAK